MNRNKSNESDTCAIRALFGTISHRTHGETVATAATALVEIARIDVQEPRAARIARIRRRGPVVAARASEVEVRVVAEAGRGKEDALVGICALARKKSPINTVLGHPCGRAIANKRIELRSCRHPPRRAEMRRRRIVRPREVTS